MTTVALRKARAGSDSFGHVWAEDGAVVDVDYDEAMALLAIPDGGFSVAENTPTPEPDVEEPDPAPEMDEVAPDPEPDASDKPAAKKTAARRRTQS